MSILYLFAPSVTAMSRWLSPTATIGGNISSQKPSLEEWADTFGDDSIKVIHHDELHDLISVGSPNLPR